ncbi:glycoside hydrolase superfamily [Kockovaella imperatae]|uniref:alpha-amylase n=1 Tax=Kockovaella imperatae TaxID=4999 RepID=A0A1Y1UTL4_9TREE|nr:glycoside hydrolase superfamily [Kockovaella imperatae]ORX41302.1 glycoside hydrolase superfamily [Kockovaella imperatae]
MLLLSNLLPLLPFLGQASAATADEWRSRSVYQIMVDRFAPPNGDSGTPCNPDDRKYCGGTWSTLVSKLDYIQGMGYDAVWISPTGLNIEGFTYYGEAYHGYWITDPTKANPHFGSDDDLKALSAALHDRGMYLMVDIAVYALASNTGDISNAALAADNGGALLFKDQADYHPKCNIKWGDHDSEMKCWLATSGVALMDLDQSNSDVGDTLINWAKDYVQEFGIDGFRIDASKHMTQDFQHRMCTTAGVFCVGEVAGDNTAYASRFQGSSAIDSVFGFGLMYGFVQSFTGGHKMTSLENKIKLAAQSYSDPTVIGQFLDNQDLPRFNSLTSDKSLVYNAIVGCFMYGGIPMIYQGLEQELSDGHDDPYNREALWLYNDFSTSTPSYVNIANVNKIRHALNGDDKFLNSVATVQSVRDQDIALVRGSALIVLTNVSHPSADLECG